MTTDLRLSIRLHGAGAVVQRDGRRPLFVFVDDRGDTVNGFDADGDRQYWDDDGRVFADMDSASDLLPASPAQAVTPGAGDADVVLSADAYREVRDALDSAREIFRSLASKTFNRAMYSHAVTASHKVNNAMRAMLSAAPSPAGDGAEPVGFVDANSLDSLRKGIISGTMVWGKSKHGFQRPLYAHPPAPDPVKQVLEDLLPKLRTIAEGFAIEAHDDQYIMVQNPDFRFDDGSPVNLVIDIYEIRDALSAAKAEQEGRHPDPYKQAEIETLAEYIRDYSDDD